MTTTKRFADMTNPEKWNVLADDYSKSLGKTLAPLHTMYPMRVMSLLSDAQEVAISTHLSERERREESNLMINAAKVMLSRMIDASLEVKGLK